MSLLARALHIFGHRATLAAPAAPNDADRARLREQLQRDEGLVLHAYRDSEGFLTIGYGHNLDADPVLRDKLLAQAGGDEAAIVITQATAERLLDTDIAIAEDAVRRALPWSETLSACRRAVLINMAFNMGLGGLLGFRRMLTACEAGDYPLAAAEMRASRWYGQTGRRAMRLATQMIEDAWT